MEKKVWRNLEENVVNRKWSGFKLVYLSWGRCLKNNIW